MELKSLLAPISTLVPTLDLSDPNSAEAALRHAFPPASDAVAAIERAARAALAAGAIAHRGEAPMRFSRVIKPEADAGGAAVDCVYMEDCAGPAHTHPNGEVVLCFPDAPGATFDGRADTWVVLPPASRHTPTVAGGSMLLLYWLPEGAVVWG